MKKAHRDANTARWL